MIRGEFIGRLAAFVPNLLLVAKLLSKALISIASQVIVTGLKQRCLCVSPVLQVGFHRQRAPLAQSPAQA